jgi:hypothetical protein
MRDDTVKASAKRINERLKHIGDKDRAEIFTKDIQELIRLTLPDREESEHIWDPAAIMEPLGQLRKLREEEVGSSMWTAIVI